VKRTLSDDRFEKHWELEELNGELKEIASRRHNGAKPTIATFFKKIQDQACSLHAVLKCGWQCYCRDAHRTMLQLESRIDDDDLHFNVMFDFPSRLITKRLDSGSLIARQDNVALLDDENSFRTGSRVSLPGAALLTSEVKNSHRDKGKGKEADVEAINLCIQQCIQFKFIETKQENKSSSPSLAKKVQHPKSVSMGDIGSSEYPSSGALVDLHFSQVESASTSGDATFGKSKKHERINIRSAYWSKHFNLILANWLLSAPSEQHPPEH
jgi:hypothetical protein